MQTNKPREISNSMAGLLNSTPSDTQRVMMQIRLTSSLEFISVSTKPSFEKSHYALGHREVILRIFHQVFGVLMAWIMTCFNFPRSSTLPILRAQSLDGLASSIDVLILRTSLPFALSFYFLVSGVATAPCQRLSFLMSCPSSLT